MSKKMSDEELIEHTKQAIAELSAVIAEFRESEANKKRAILLGYWLKTYSRYL